MIVADANTIAYLYLPTAFTDDVAAVLRQDAHWTAPLITADRMLLKVFPDIAMTPDTFLRGRPHKSHK